MSKTSTVQSSSSSTFFLHPFVTYAVVWYFFSFCFSFSMHSASRRASHPDRIPPHPSVFFSLIYTTVRYCHVYTIRTQNFLVSAARATMGRGDREYSSNRSGSNSRGGALHLARIHGTEEDRVNCPFYFKIGTSMSIVVRKQ